MYICSIRRLKLAKDIIYQMDHCPLNIEGFDTIRQSFAQFGLGVRTGIDLPNETDRL